MMLYICTLFLLQFKFNDSIMALFHTIAGLLLFSFSVPIAKKKQ